MSTVAVIQARMNSSRLPGKVIMPLAGRPMVVQLADRLRLSGCCDRVLVATGAHPSTAPLLDVCRAHDIPVYVGDLEDLLGRTAAAVAQTADDADVVVRVTGDCPLADPDYIAARAALVRERGLDFTYCRTSTLVYAGASVMSRAFLDRMDREVTDARDRAHCGLTWALRHRDEVRSLEVMPDPVLNATAFRLTVDEKPDYEMMSRLYDALYRPGSYITLADAVDYLTRHPEVAALNAAVRQNPLPEKCAPSAPDPSAGKQESS